LYTIDECIEESKEKKFSDVHEPFSLSTPLHLACYSGNLGILKKLILSEMDYRARDINGNEPIHYACIGLHFDIIDYILTTIGPKAACQVSNSLNSSFDPPLAVIMFSTHAAGRDASRESIVKCMEILIRHGADINFVNLETRLNYIHRAAGHNFSESIDVLCKSNCDVMAKDPSGDTPLHIAVKLLAEDSIKSLLDHGAFPNIFNREGKRPIQCIPNIPVASMPTAISLISGGARIQLNELPDHLQSNFDALQKYEKECQETFVEVVSEGKARNFKWIEDNSSKVCLACGAEFTMFVRRHHCRHCGILSCGACSSRAYRNPGSDSLRCCDSCYNMLKRMHQKDQKKPLPPIPSITSEESNSAKSKQQKSLPSIPKSSNRSLSTNSMVSSSKDSKKSTNPSSSDTSKVLNETKQRLQNRGEKLSQLEEKSSQLENNASDFANLARQLRQKQEKSWF
jgi:ankyrin repeat protein